MENYSWPSPRTSDYLLKTKPLPRELAHAIGIIIIAWNDIEAIQLDLLRKLLGFTTSGRRFRMGSRLLDPMGNKTRADLLRGLVREMDDLPEATAETILAFQTHYDICLGNRNLVAHSQYIEEEHGILISSFKATPHLSYRYIPDEAEFWEQTIFEMRILSNFGFDLVDTNALLGPAPDLPKIPPQPRNLLMFLEVHKIKLGQPASSEGE